MPPDLTDSKENGEAAGWRAASSAPLLREIGRLGLTGPLPTYSRFSALGSMDGICYFCLLMILSSLVAKDSMSLPDE